jgi:hypothetical protein
MPSWTLNQRVSELSAPTISISSSVFASRAVPVEVGEGDLLPRAQRTPGEDQDRPVGAGDQELAGDERGGDDAEADGRSAEPAREAAGLVQGAILHSGSIGM